jgi:predicted metalloprotease
MSSLAELPELIGFFSYSREDDEAFKGTLSGLRDGIYRELSAQLGRSKKTFRLWQDQEAIASGKLWETEIQTAINQSIFFIPIVTPRSVNSKHCKFEFESFLAREKAINRSDLIFPILYISVAALENEAKWRDDPVLSTIGRRQYVDWRPLRHLDVQTTAVREQIERLCRNIVEALNEPWVAPEERRRMEEARAGQQAEEEARRLEAEAKRRAHEEEQQRQAEAEARQRADEERSRLEAEAKRRADEVESQKRAEAEARQRADEERRRQEAEAKLEAEQKEAFAAAKHADRVAAIDAFLANHPESRHTTEAQTLRAALVARDEACGKAMASEDPAVLKAFLKTYPKSTSAPQVRDRLRHLQPQKVWPISRNAVFVGLGVLAASGLLLLLHFAVRTPPTQILRDQKSDNPAPLPRAVDTARAPEDDMGRFVSRVFGSTELQWKQIFAEDGRTYSAPILVLYNGATRADCGGVAQSAMGPFYCPVDQTVYLDTSFFDQIARRFRGCDRTCQFSQAYVIAHEVGHHLQNLLGILPKAQQAQRAASSPANANYIQVQVELQADCLAGVWANHEYQYLRSQGKPLFIEPGDVEVALRTAAAIGDDTLQRKAQGYVVPDSFTHGSSEQRQRWFNTGFQSAKVASCNTFAAAQL